MEGHFGRKLRFYYEWAKHIMKGQDFIMSGPYML